jgi:hypothetical protein
MNPGDLPENLGRPMPEPDRATVEDQYTMAAITGLLAGPVGSTMLHTDQTTATRTHKAVLRNARIIARLAMEDRNDG